MHRLLEYTYDEERQGFYPKRDASNPLPYDVIVIDEISMVDVVLACRLLDAIGPKTRLLMVGDHNQIPSVKAGAVLRDILAARAHFAESINVLDEVVRQAGELARNTTAVLTGAIAPSAPRSVAWQVHRIKRSQEGGAASMIASVVEMVTTAPQPLEPFGRFLDLDWDVQVLTPQHKTVLGTYALNVELQKLRQRLLGNPEPPPVEGNMAPKPLPGDRVLWTKNDYELGLFNGTQAVVLGYPKGGSMMLFTEDGREVEIPPAKRNCAQVAYAMTIHKSQGSEWPFVILVASSLHWKMHDRNLLYTGMSRASESLMLVGDDGGMRNFATARLSEERKTFGELLVHGWEPSTGQPRPVAVPTD